MTATDTVAAYIFPMLWRATAVTYLTHLISFVIRLRSRCLAHWLRVLLLQSDPAHLHGHAAAIAQTVLRHPLIGAPARPGDFVTREQLTLILLELADSDADFPFAPALRTAVADPAVLGRLNLWFDQAMLRATRDYRRRAGILTGLAALLVLAVTAEPRAILSAWIPLSLGTPFWYDLLKRLVPLLRGGPAIVRRRLP